MTQPTTASPELPCPDPPADHTGPAPPDPYRDVQRSEHTPAVVELDREASTLPSFRTPMESVEELIEWGRSEYGHPGTWKTDSEEDQDHKDPVDLHCSKGLHERTPENTARNGACKVCARITRKRRAGHSVCWTGVHDKPEEGLICECGEAPPASDWLDWAQVESAVSEQELDRPLTNAEAVSAIRTMGKRWGFGPYEAATKLGIPRGRARYLLGKWDKGRNTPDATTAMLSDYVGLGDSRRYNESA